MEEQMEYGLRHEPDAIAAFERETGLLVVTDGDLYCKLNIKGKEFIGKVDGYVPEKNAIIEVKCPKSERFPYLIEAKKNEWKLLSDPPYQYYHQVQAYMQATETDLCYFVVWTPSTKVKIAEVKRDDTFFENAVRPCLEKHE